MARSLGGRELDAWRRRWPPPPAPSATRLSREKQHPLGDRASAGDAGLRRPPGPPSDPAGGRAWVRRRRCLAPDSGRGRRAARRVGGLSTHDATSMRCRGPPVPIAVRVARCIVSIYLCYGSDLTKPEYVRSAIHGTARRWPRWRVAPTCSSSPSSACSTRARCTATSCASGSTPRSGRSARCPTAPSTRRCATCSTAAWIAEAPQATGRLRAAGAPASSTSSPPPARSTSRTSSPRPGRGLGGRRASTCASPSSPAPTQRGAAAHPRGPAVAARGAARAGPRGLGPQPRAAWTPTPGAAAARRGDQPSARCAGSDELIDAERRTHRPRPPAGTGRTPAHRHPTSTRPVHHTTDLQENHGIHSRRHRRRRQLRQLAGAGRRSTTRTPTRPRRRARPHARHVRRLPRPRRRVRRRVRRRRQEGRQGPRRGDQRLREQHHQDRRRAHDRHHRAARPHPRRPRQVLPA